LECFEERKERIDFEKKLIYENVSYSNYLSSPRGQYHKYLESLEWKAKRELVKRDGYICTQCKCKPAFHAHHLTYENIFNEKLEDLISVCADCHSKIHYKELMQLMIYKTVNHHPNNCAIFFQNNRKESKDLF
jgi:hypothetical protein